jgi:hypothetical protein
MLGRYSHREASVAWQLHVRGPAKEARITRLVTGLFAERVNLRGTSIAELESCKSERQVPLLRPLMREFSAAGRYPNGKRAYLLSGVALKTDGRALRM